jgi:hypothetical protein
MNRRYSLLTCRFVRITAQIILFLVIFSSVSLGKYSGGNGEPNDPYLISTPNDLNEISHNPGDWNKNFFMTNDINMASIGGSQYEPIGGEHSNPFTGIFEGNNHVITNFTCFSDREMSVGLFGYTATPAVLKNIGFIDPNVQAPTSNWVGVLAGETSQTTIKNCSAHNVIINGNGAVGGLIGFSWSSSIFTPFENCHTSGIFQGDGGVGGLVGGGGAYIINCSSSGQVISNGYSGGLTGTCNNVISHSFSDCNVIGGGMAGGLVGYFYNAQSGGSYDHEIGVTNSYATGSVHGENYVGGLVGYLSEAKIDSCYSTGNVSVNTVHIGGLVSYINDGKVFDSFWDTETSEIDYSAGGCGKTTEQMKDYNTYLSWGCSESWTINDGNDYPHLLWEGETGSLIIKTNYGGGEGTEENPYLIQTAEQLNQIGLHECDYDKYFKLVSDINLIDYNGSELNLIGYYDSSEELPFKGVFDGNNHTIYNFNYQSSDTDGVGLFRYVGGAITDTADIMNLRLVNPNVDGGNGNLIGAIVGKLEYGSLTNCSVEGGSVTGNEQVGGLAGFFRRYAPLGHIISDCHANINVSGSRNIGGIIGYTDKGKIINCSSEGFVSGTSEQIGGLIGYITSGVLSNSYSDSNVNGQIQVGGLAGQCTRTDVTDCYSTGEVEGTENRTGGLIGNCVGNTVMRCFATGTVSGQSYVGGLIGLQDGHNQASTILNCYATGQVEGNSKYIGGLVGYNISASIEKSYAVGPVTGSVNFGGLVGGGYSSIVEDSVWDINTTGQIISDGGVGKTTEQMKKKETFIGWACEDAWNIQEYVDYPHLLWESQPGTPLIDFLWFGAGTGEPNEPFLIYTPEQLNRIGLLPCHYDKHFQLMNDIDLSNYDGQEDRPKFNIIGESYNNPFMGVFDGGGHSIYNFSYEATDDYAGFFGSVEGTDSVIKNLILVDPNLYGNRSYTGALVGKLVNGTLRQCQISGGNVQGGGCIGGLIGNFSTYKGGEISQCISTASVEGHTIVGGFIGALSGEYQPDNTSAKVLDCYCISNVKGIDYVGGFIGYQSHAIARSYCASSIEGTTGTGAFVGMTYTYPDVNLFEGCFYDVNINPDMNGLGYRTDPNLIGLSTVEMQMQETFINAGWDFVGEAVNGTNDVWDICDGTNYPKLAWQIPVTGDFDCPDGVDFIDYSILAGFWQSETIEQDYNHDGFIDFYDWAFFADSWDSDYVKLSLFLDQWLSRTAALVDIAPDEADDFIDWQDLKLFCENWLEE